MLLGLESNVHMVQMEKGPLMVIPVFVAQYIYRRCGSARGVSSGHEATDKIAAMSLSSSYSTWNIWL